MSASDRSWTVAPTFLWFGVALVVGLVGIDGDVDAIADRLSVHRTDALAATAAAGPAFTAPVAVAEADADDDSDADSGGGGSGGSGGSGSGSGSGSAAIPHTAADAALDDTCVDGPADHCKRWAMDGLYKSIASSKAGSLGRAVRVSWYGDSVVANDEIPGRLRTRLQATLGDGGPGYVFVIPPHRFNAHEAITRSYNGGWNTHAISTTTVADGLYGPGGSTTETDGDKAKVTIKLVAGKVTNVDLYYLAQPHGGTATVTADGGDLVHADTRADAKAGGFAAGTIAGGASAFVITTDGKVRLFGIDLENASGAVVDNLGVVSVNVKSFAQNDATHVTAELAHREADLVMIMIGANEAQWLGPADQDTKLYQGNYEKVLAPIRKARPDAACLVVSPTDQAFEQDGAYPSRPVMPILVDAQRKAARAAGCAFFSTYDWMGGKGSAASWFKHGLVGSDFQHLSRKGANKLGDAVYDALMHGYARYAAR